MCAYDNFLKSVFLPQFHTQLIIFKYCSFCTVYCCAQRRFLSFLSFNVIFVTALFYFVLTLYRIMFVEWSTFANVNNVPSDFILTKCSSNNRTPMKKQVRKCKFLFCTSSVKKFFTFLLYFYPFLCPASTHLLSHLVQGKHVQNHQRT